MDNIHCINLYQKYNNGRLFKCLNVHVLNAIQGFSLLENGHDPQTLID